MGGADQRYGPEVRVTLSSLCDDQCNVKQVLREHQSHEYTLNGVGHSGMDPEVRVALSSSCDVQYT